MTSFSGSSTVIRRSACALWWVRTNDSRNSISVMVLVFATPSVVTNSRIAAAGYPLRRMPCSVGIRASSQPSTVPSSTSARR